MVCASWNEIIWPEDLTASELEYEREQAYFINIHVSLLAGHLHHTLDASSSCGKIYWANNASTKTTYTCIKLDILGSLVMHWDQSIWICRCTHHTFFRSDGNHNTGPLAFHWQWLVVRKTHIVSQHSRQPRIAWRTLYRQECGTQLRWSLGCCSLSVSHPGQIARREPIPLRRSILG